MILNSLDFSRSYGQLLENPKTRGSRELFLPENNFKIYLPIDFPKNIQTLEACKLTKDMKLRLEFFSHALLHPAFKIQVLNMSMLRLFQNFSICLGNMSTKNCQQCSRNLCILQWQWLQHTSAFC